MVAGVVKSAARVLELFEWFAHHRAPATLSEVAVALGYPISSASGLLKSLHRLGYVEYDRRQRLYVPTIRFAVLGSWIYEEMFGEETGLLRLMDHLRQATRETVSLGMQNDLHLQYLRILQSPEAVRFYIKPGTSRPVCISALGKVLLSIQPESTVNVLVRRHNGSLPEDADKLAWKDYIEELREVRRLGYAMTEGAVVPGGGVIAMLLPTPPGHRPLAIGVGAPVDRLRKTRPRIIELMQEAIADYGSSALPRPR